MATFKNVQEAEKQELQGVRERAPGTRLPDKTVGLAFSGGGIRSATFHLGVLQELAKHKLLKQVDYLSTVSGGGYIGSWLARWIQQEGVAEVERKLPGNREEAPEVNFLRDYSNFLTPRKGLLGADTWAAIATYLRNLLLNQAILVTFLGAVLFLPWILGSTFASTTLRGMSTHGWSIVSAVFTVFAVAAGTFHTSACSDGKPPAFTRQIWVLVSVVLPLFIGAFLLTYAIWEDPAQWPLELSVRMGMVVYGLGHLLGWLASRLQRKDAPADFRNILWAVPSGAFAGIGVHGLALLLARWGGAEQRIGIWHAVSWGPPLAVLVFLLAGTLHTGLAKFALSFEMHEWWARLGGWLMLWSLFWSALFAVAIFAPRGVEKIAYLLWTKRVLISGWLVYSSYGAWLGWSKDTGGKKENEPATKKSLMKELMAKAAPFVFVAGLFILLACGVHELAVLGIDRRSQGKSYWGIAAQIRNAWQWEAFGILIVLSIFLSWRVDINRFSMNLVYRNRIVRCYLGASNPNRKAQPFTGFDPADDVHLESFAQPDKAAGKGAASIVPGGKPAPPVRPYGGPYPILNGTLNVSHGRRLAWQERKAESFVFTPRFCGYDFPEFRSANGESKEAGHGAYQPTAEWAFRDRGIFLGSAVAISGAAVNPNSGFHTFPPLAFLMTVFNVRLGVWLANPRFGNEEYWLRLRRPQGGPALSLLYLLKELFASATDESKYVNLSDGAHFENLALYELVRRECDFIISGDAGEDPGPGFEDLANAIRKCRTDLGAEIELTTTPFKITGADGYATGHAAFGTITYPSKKLGKLLYIKCSVTEKDPADVLAYKRTHDAFPHQSTADQWFDESQFESYRMLGRCSMRSVISPVKAPSGIPDLFT